jgi:RNA polymerase sigma-70 factor (ECF subfamily)
MREADLERLYARLEKPLYNVVYRWVWKQEEAQDIVQEAFLRLWRMSDKVRMESVDPLIYRIALNLASSAARSKRIWRWVTLEALGEAVSTARSAEEGLAADEQSARIRTAISSLPEELRKVVMLCEFSRLSYREIAEVLSIPAGTVGSRRNRALKELKLMLSKRSEGSAGRARQTV